MSENRWNVPGFDEHAMPCEKCGDLVAIGSTDTAATVGHWADGLVRVFCADCWPHGDAS